jgi:enamine deaminase RidA (YjgF/YER057c/UK114 family)
MSVEALNPEGLQQSDGYHQIMVGAGSRIVFMSGQIARLPDGTLVGEGDLAAQIEQAYVNVNTAVVAAGGTFDDVAKITLYIVDWSPEKEPAMVDGIIRAAGRLGVDPRKATTLIGVSALMEPALLVEIEATAVLS